MLSYEVVFSRFRNKVNDPKELSLKEADLLEIYTERLHSAVGNVRIGNLFSSLSLDDEHEEISWTFKHTRDATTDEEAQRETEFVVELLALAMKIEWLKPQVDSITYIGMAIGGKEEKVLNNMHKTNIERLHSLDIELARYIRDHGYLFNDYLG